jgi:type I restriction enzyme S subunit
MMDISISIPNLTEQEKIGAFFAKLDKLISLQQRKVEKLKNIKKALLNKMFI